jgi:wobble nucleotide-excising tRNase
MLLTSENIGVIYCQIKCKQTISADAVKSKLSEDIVKIINEKTAPLITKIDNLEKENRKLKNEVDALEQYGRRILDFVSGFSRTLKF